MREYLEDRKPMKHLIVPKYSSCVIDTSSRTYYITGIVGFPSYIVRAQRRNRKIHTVKPRDIASHNVTQLDGSAARGGIIHRYYTRARPGCSRGARQLFYDVK